MIQDWALLRQHNALHWLAREKCVEFVQRMRKAHQMALQNRARKSSGERNSATERENSCGELCLNNKFQNPYAYISSVHTYRHAVS